MGDVQKFMAVEGEIVSGQSLMYQICLACQAYYIQKLPRGN